MKKIFLVLCYISWIGTTIMSIIGGLYETFPLFVERVLEKIHLTWSWDLFWVITFPLLLSMVVFGLLSLKESK